MKNQKTRTLVECAIMIAVATVLSLVKVWEMPFGGSITLLSMLPICLISIRHGLKWGLASSFVFAVGQIALGLGSLMSWGMTPAIWAGCLIFDYIVAFTVLGLAGMFRNKGRIGMCLGIGTVVFMRFCSHLVSGTIFFASTCPEGWNPFIYSICYNGAYMLPEMILTIIAAVIISKIPALQKKF